MDEYVCMNLCMYAVRHVDCLFVALFNCVKYSLKAWRAKLFKLKMLLTWLT